MAFVEELKQLITRHENKRWNYHVDVSNSCFRMDDATIHGVSLYGKGHVNYEDADIKIQMRVTIGNSEHVQFITSHQKGLTAALQLLCEFPLQATVCRECGKIRVGKENPCKDCMFFEYFSTIRQCQDTCSICQDPTYRTILPCGHAFHMTCLLQMDPFTAKCPNCRSPIPDKIMKDLFGDFDVDSDDDLYDEYDHSH